MSLYIQRTLESFFNRPVKEWPKTGALVRVHCPRSGQVQYIVISNIENRCITTFNDLEQRVMRIRIKELYGLELGLDSAILFQQGRAFIGKVQFTKIYAFTRDLSPRSKCQRTIQVLVKDYFEYIAQVEGPLAGFLNAECIRLVQEYMC